MEFLCSACIEHVFEHAHADTKAFSPLCSSLLLLDTSNYYENIDIFSFTNL